MRRLMIILLLLCSIGLLYANPGHNLDSAKNMYLKGDYYEAQVIYQNLADSGYVAHELFYNLANCYFRNEQYAQAIYYYEKSLQLKPRDESALKNLDIANSRITDKISVLAPVFYVNWYRNVQQWFSSDAWAWGFVLLLGFSVASVVLYLLAARRSLKKTGFSLAAVFLILSLISLHYSVVQRDAILHSNYAIVFDDVMIKSSPSTDGNNLFEIHKGLKVSITDTLNNWTEIRLPDGKQGWAESSALKKL